jgi:hypothetical protein
MLKRFEYLEYNGLIYILDSRGKILKTFIIGEPPEPKRGSRELHAVKDPEICSAVMKNAFQVTKEYAWRLLLKAEGKSTIVKCNLCQKELEIYQDPICCAKISNEYVDLCETCFNKEYDGILRLSEEEYPLVTQNKSDIGKANAFEAWEKNLRDPPWELWGDNPPAKGRSNIVLDSDRYSIKHGLKLHKKNSDN